MNNDTHTHPTHPFTVIHQTHHVADHKTTLDKQMSDLPSPPDESHSIIIGYG